MLTETTITKLREMRLSVMANALKDQLEDPQYRNMTFEDRLEPWRKERLMRLPRSSLNKRKN